ncbi:GlsB/YeaQ/YmgE family stress response membrane protein [Candidatus Saccharibacteria bacterium]|nr:GlsB/YeaQ/YmgE family stress response membrane protein [Candidatus Saccharibacteria bacterium]
MWSIIVWIIVGALAGWIASKIMKTDESMGAVANIVVGIIGAFLGGWLVGLFGIEIAEGEFNVPSILTAILGAVVLIAILKAVTGRRRV